MNLCVLWLCLSPQPFISAPVAIWSATGLRPLEMIPCREDDDCTACTLWAVTRQNWQQSSKRLSVSLPLTSLSLYTASICTFIAWCLPLSYAIRSYWGAGMLIFDNKHIRYMGAVWVKKHVPFYITWEDFQGIVWICGLKASRAWSLSLMYKSSSL